MDPLRLFPCAISQIPSDCLLPAPCCPCPTFRNDCFSLLPAPKGPQTLAPPSPLLRSPTPSPLPQLPSWTQAAAGQGSLAGRGRARDPCAKQGKLAQGLSRSGIWLGARAPYPATPCCCGRHDPAPRSTPPAPGARPAPFPAGPAPARSSQVAPPTPAAERATSGTGSPASRPSPRSAPARGT